jgi:glycosyltransferase involved in cell wall biosynthesis
MKRLRIVQVIPSLGLGGAEQMAGHLMAGLAETHEVIGATLYAATGNSIEQKLSRAGVRLVHLNKRPGFDLRMYRALARLFREVRPDVVHTHLGVLRYVFPASMRCRIPVVLHTIHNMAEYETDRIGRLVQWFAFRRAVVPVAISKEVATSMERVYGLACRALVPNCIPVEEYHAGGVDRACLRARQGFHPDDVIFTCVARLVPQKNPMMLIRAFEALQNPRAQLVMIGDGELRAKLIQYVKSRGLGPCVHLPGKLPNIPEWLAVSDAFVLSSDWEGNPLAVMEAMAAGLPVVCTAVGGVPELVESGREGLLVPPGDEMAFTAALRYILTDNRTRTAMGLASRARAMAEFDLSRMVGQYSNLYEHAWEFAH